MAGYRANAYHGLATVAGAWLNITVTWTQVFYSVTFNETGLKSNNQWGVGLSPPRPPTNVSGGGTRNSTGSSITFQVSNGKISFIIDGSASYLATPGSGTIVVAGAPVNVEITFVLPPPWHKWVTFSEKRLPLPDQLGGRPEWDAHYVGEPHHLIQRAERHLLRVDLSGGGWGPSPANLTVTVPSDTGPFTIYFLHVYPVEFTESDLPQSTNWSVSVTGNATESVLVGDHPSGGFSRQLHVGRTGHPRSASTSRTARIRSPLPRRANRQLRPPGRHRWISCPGRFNVPSESDLGNDSGSTWYWVFGIIA